MMNAGGPDNRMLRLVSLPLFAVGTALAIEATVLAQGFTWNRTTQTHRTWCNASASAMGAWNQDAADSGQILGDLAVAGVPTQSASANDGLDPPSSAQASAQTDGECEFNPNNQAVLQWAFIHNQAVSGSTSGPASYASAYAAQFDTMNVAAQLNNPDPNAQVTGHLRLDIGWVSNADGGAINVRGANVQIAFGAASLTVSVDQNFLTLSAVGIDGNGNLFARDSATAFSSPTGSLAIAPNEFTATLQAGSSATIQVTQLQSELVIPFLMPDLSTAAGDILQGTIEIHAD